MVFMNGLSFLNVELTSRCNKSCWCCGRRKLEREHPELCQWGDMDYELVKEIAKQVPKGIVVQLHNNGEPLLYRGLGRVLEDFKGNIRSFNTNGKLLLERADEIIGNLETLTVSVIQDDEEGDEQYEIVKRFLSKKGPRKPFMVYRLLGKVDHPERWASLPGVIARRVLHSPMGSYDYQKTPTIPEIGICLDLLTHLAINRFGHVSACVRFDPEGHLIIGDLNRDTLETIWNGKVRKHYIDCHLKGHRDWLKGCDRCEYFGIPRGE